MNGNGQYQPRESVKLWFAEGQLSATMISKQGTISVEQDLSDNHDYYFHYKASSGTWDSQTEPFPPFNMADDFSEDYASLVPLISIRRGVAFEGLSFSGLRLVAEA